MKAKRILAMVALAITMPAMAQTMYDGRSCEDWKNHFNAEVSRLKTEIKTLEMNAKTSGDTKYNLKVAKRAASQEKKATISHNKAQKKGAKLQNKQTKTSNKLVKMQAKSTKAEQNISKMQLKLQKAQQNLENINSDIANLEKQLQNIETETGVASDAIDQAKEAKEAAKRILVEGVKK